MNDSVGARLRKAREFRGLTLQQVSETTKVRSYYLQALESDDHSAIPSAAQARGFLRIYADFLQMDLAELLPPSRPVETPPPEAAASGISQPKAEAPHPTLWTNLRERLRSRGKKQPAPETTGAAPAVPSREIAAAPEDASEPVPPQVQEPQAAAVPVKTKTPRRAKVVAPKPPEGISPDDIKKNSIG